jgi:UBX domain-containing protein 1
MYAGGEKSGIAVQGRGKDTENDLVKQILEQAQKGGEKHQEQPKETTFIGHSNKLGAEETAQASSSSSSQPPKNEQVSRLLTFWKDGFSIEDGPLLRYDDPENQAHLTAIKSGRAPTELLGVKTNQSVEVKVAHRMEEEFVPPPKKPMAAFTGTGNRLGSITTSQPVAVTSGSKSAEVGRQTSVEVDNNKPVTQIQVRLGDGTRMVARFNYTHTVGNLRQFVQLSRSEGREFVLQTTMPTKVLEDDGLTLEQAGLLNAVVVQRYK